MVISANTGENVGIIAGSSCTLTTADPSRETDSEADSDENDFEPDSSDENDSETDD